MQTMIRGAIALVRYYTCLTLLLLAFVGCEKKYPDEKPVDPVTGTVLVDGTPQEGIQVTLHDDAGPDPSKPTYSTGYTDASGKLVISTYATGDGAPAGNYHPTFLWGQVNPISMSYGGPDKLKGRYSDASKSDIVLQVSERGPNDLGVVELTTK
jgi:hypothetical protein